MHSDGALRIPRTFADHLGAVNPKAPRFEQLTDEGIRSVYEFEQVTGAPVSLIATGFQARRGAIDRRQW